MFFFCQTIILFLVKNNTLISGFFISKGPMTVDNSFFLPQSITIFTLPALGNVKGHIALGLSVRPSIHSSEQILRPSIRTNFKMGFEIS